MRLVFSPLLKAVSVLAFAIGTSPVSADLLFYDGFNYSAGEDALQGRSIWQTVRTSGASSDIVASSLGYKDTLGNVLQTSAGCVFVDSSEESAQVENLGTIPPGSLNTPSSTHWFSCLLQKQGTSLRFAGVSFQAPDNTLQPNDSNTTVDEIFNLGTNTNQNPQMFRVVDRALAAPYTQNATSATSAYSLSLLVLKLELNVDGTANERFTLWVNPLLSAEPDPSQGFTFTSQFSDLPNWDALTTIRLAAGNTSGGEPATNLFVDEIRIGETFADVTPYDAPFQVDSISLQPDGSTTVRWPSKADRVDTLESSTDMVNWQLVPNSTRNGYLQQRPTQFEVNVPAPALIPPAANQRLYFRVHRNLLSTD